MSLVEQTNCQQAGSRQELQLGVITIALVYAALFVPFRPLKPIRALQYLTGAGLPPCIIDESPSIIIVDSNPESNPYLITKQCLNTFNKVFEIGTP